MQRTLFRCRACCSGPTVCQAPTRPLFLGQDSRNLSPWGQEMGFQGAQRFWPPRSGMLNPQHIWGVRVEGTVVITTSFPQAGEPVPRSRARERRQLVGAGMRAGVGEASQAFQRGQGHSLLCEEFLRFISIRREGCLCVSASSVPKAGRGFLQAQLLPNMPQLSKGQAHPSPDTAHSFP